MYEIILHHFDASPFAEKVRVALGIKGASWREVIIPMVMPKPNLTALTGGYRKTPVLQLGADIYCDTRLIAEVLDELCDGPQLFPDGGAGQAAVFAAWADQALFRPGAGLSMGTNPALPEAVLADRFAFFDFLDQASLPAQLPHLYASLQGNLALLEQALADGRPWLMGDEPCWADAACYAPVWMCRANVADAEAVFAGLERLQQWQARMAQIGHGTCLPLSSEHAITVAREAAPQARPRVERPAWSSLELGDQVSVAPDDYGAVPVCGTLLQLTGSRVVITRTDERAGEVAVHFPRLGYVVEKL